MGEGVRQRETTGLCLPLARRNTPDSALNDDLADHAIHNPRVNHQRDTVHFGAPYVQHFQKKFV